MKLRRLTDAGLASFRGYLAALKDDPRLPVPDYLLEDAAASERLPTDAEVEPREFASRFEAAEYLYGVLAASGLPGLDRDRGLWAWLTIFYFGQLCPANGKGERKPGETARYVPVLDNYFKFYRHLLLSPWRIYRAHADEPTAVGGILMNPVHKPGELYEQVASRQELVSNRLFLNLVNALYVDKEANKLKTGLTSDKGGAPRRLADVLGQFELNFDMFMIEPERMLSMLPKEFNKFR